MRIDKEDIRNIMREHFIEHKSLFLTIDGRGGRAIFFHNYTMPKYIVELLEFLKTGFVDDIDRGTDILIRRDKKSVMQNKSEFVVKLIYIYGDDSDYVSIEFYGIAGVKLKRRYGKRIDTSLELLDKPFYKLNVSLETGKVYSSGRNDRFIPVYFGTYLSKLLLENKTFAEIFKSILRLCQGDKNVVKDILRTIEKDGFVAPEINLFEAMECYNMNDLMHKHTGENLNYNKLGLNFGHFINMIKGYIPENEMEFLRQLDRKEYLIAMRGAILNSYKSNNYVEELIIQYYLHRTMSLEYSIDSGKSVNVNSLIYRYHGAIIRDYVRMAIDHNRKISLRFKSTNRIKREHDNLVEQLKKETLSEEMNQPLLIENSAFSRLRDKLPEDFHWISTTQELYDEGEKQRNCVFFYRERVRRDESTIYSWEKDGRHYTIEFKLRGATPEQGYHIAQMLQKYNAPPNKEDLDYVNSLLR